MSILECYTLLAIRFRFPIASDLWDLADEVIRQGYRTTIEVEDELVEMVRPSIGKLVKGGFLKRYLHFETPCYILTELGLDTTENFVRAKMELEKIMTPRIASIAIEKDKDPLHDALIDANAHELLIYLFDQYPEWVMDWIARTSYE
jgi:hypothetical protein